MSEQSGASPTTIELELVRSKEPEDPFAFRFVRQTYLVRGAEGAYQSVELPWSRDLLADLDALRRPDRDAAIVASVGNLLRQLLVPAGWSGLEDTIVGARAERRVVHLTVRSAAAELYALPWELLTLRADGQHLGGLNNVLLRYAWPGTPTIQRDAATADGAPRLLVAWSAAGGAVPAAEHIASIRSANERDEPVDIQVVPHATFGAIADALHHAEDEGKPFTGLHLLCHGAEAGSSFGLCFDAEGDDGRPVVVDGLRIQQLLVPYAHSLRLVVVSACDGGNMGQPGNRIGSIAQRLHRGGLSHVIASRYPLSTRGSTRVAAALYRSLLAGGSVEQAFVEARTAATREVEQLDWASLQLYARPEDGDAAVLFAPPAVVSDAITKPEPAPDSADVVAPVVMTPLAPEPAMSSGPWLKVAIAAGVLAAVGVGAWWMSGKGEPDPMSAAAVGEPVVAGPSEPSEPSEPVPAGPPDVPASVATGTQPEGSGGSTGESPHADGDGVDAKAPVTAVTRTTTTRRPSAPQNTGRPAEACTRGIRDLFNDNLARPSGGPYKVELWAYADGSTKIKKCDGCSDEQGRLKTGLKSLRSHLISTGSTGLPCRVSFTWQK